MLNTSSAILMGVASLCCLLDCCGPESQCIQKARADRGQRADCGKGDEHALPSERIGDLRDTGPGQDAADITDSIDHSGGNCAALLAAEVERKRTAQVRVGAEQTE